MKRILLAFSVASGAVLVAAACGGSSSSSATGSSSEDLSTTTTAALTTSTATALRVRLLAGTASTAPPYKDSAGNTWTHDEDFDTGSGDSNKDPISGTADPTLFHSERYASRTASPDGFTYTFDDIIAGKYQVTLDFAETSNGPVRAARQRQFDVYIDDTEELTNFDIFAEAGGLDKAISRTFTVEAGSSLTVRFAPGATQNPKVNALSIVPLFTVAPVTMHPIDATFFGMHANNTRGGLQYGTQRIWDTGAAWWQLQDGGTTTFAPLHGVLEKSPAGTQLMYTFGRTPTAFANKKQEPTAKCAYDPPGGGPDGGEKLYECAPPSDVERDGGGTDSYVTTFWNDFFDEQEKADAGDAKPIVCPKDITKASPACIRYIELWNEPNADGFWSGTYQQLARMSADSSEIIHKRCPQCVVVTSNVSCGGDGGHVDTTQTGQCDLWMDKYLTAWQKLVDTEKNNYADAVSWHPYSARTNVAPVPFPETNLSTWDTCAKGKESAAGECTCKAGFVPNKECRYSVVDQFAVMTGIFDKHGLGGKPVFATEGAWGDANVLPDPEEQAAYLARWYTILAGQGVAQAYWYAKDDDFGRLVEDDGGLTDAAVAYKNLYDWLVGTSIGACTASGTVWSCPVTEPGNREGLILWDTDSSHSEAVNKTYTRVRALDGSSGKVTGAEVSIGARPVIVD